ncbi:protein kinase rad3 [Podospora australis]|uniref:Serine/threonine-protein kinase MEC1 n=1 Tax=Podospora australis TaxID=1536484 RepID=A0AAN7ANC8_9PEZI|nr:protein kinase rad3 [Podospora australis]
MASQFQNRASRQGQHAFPSSQAPGTNGPPTSTLAAAQLIENISASSTRSARPDENTELRNLSAVIDRAKSDPNFFKSHEERVEHNNLIVYVVGCVFFKNLKLDDDDPFADRAKLRSDVLKTLEILKTLFEETPTVLNCTTDGKAFLHRGREPLWFWILPKLLYMLGHTKCSALSSEIQDIFRFILELAAPNGDLWDLGVSLMQYLQANIAAVLADFSPNPKAPVPRKPTVDIRLPPSSVHESLSENEVKECSFHVRGHANAIRFAACLLAAAKEAVIPPSSESEVSLLYAQHLVWILDSLQSLALLVATSPIPLETRLAAIVRTTLDVAAAYSSSEQTDWVFRDKANATLVLVCRAVVENPDQLLAKDEDISSQLQSVVSSALIHLAKASIDHRPTSRLLASGLATSLETLIKRNPAICNSDFWRATRLINDAVSSKLPTQFSADVAASNFVDDILRKQVEKVLVIEDHKELSQPPQKRRKVSDDALASQELSEVVRRICRLLNIDASTPIEDVADNMTSQYPKLDESVQCLLVDLISRLFCAADNALELRRRSTTDDFQFDCKVCSGNGSALSADHHDANVKSIGVDLFSKVITSPVFPVSKRTRIYAMIVLRRLAKHSPGDMFWDLETSIPGQWCLQSLHSSIRELRIAAGRVLPFFICDSTLVDHAHDVVKRNVGVALGILKKHFERGGDHLQETCIMAWGQVGRVASDDELNLVLIQLVEYLGHRNNIVSAFAFNEILNLADSRGETPRRLFQPFWSNLAFSVVKDLAANPQTTARVAELLKMSVQELLRVVQKHALPWLVLSRRRNVIQKIAEARGDTETWQPLMDTTNAPSILARLLAQDVPDVAEHAMSLLRHVSEHFSETSLVELLRTEPHPIALELLKAGAVAVDDDRRSQTRKALSTLATLLLNESKDKKKKSHVIGRFLQPYAFPLTYRLVEVISDTYMVNPPLQEQKVCLRAMEEMIRITGQYICDARPQISACLLSALASEELRPAAFSCWVAMLMSMGDVEALLETTFFVIGLYYNSFTEQAKGLASSLLDNLLEEHNHLMVEYSHRLPSLRHISELEGFRQKFEALQPRLTIEEKFSLFGRRLSHEYPGVVQQALTELVEYLDKHQGYILTSALSERPGTIVISLTRSVLDCSAKYNGWQPGITRLCAQALGLIGCLDSNRLETTREPKQFVLAYNFDHALETTAFVAFTLENVIVKAFMSTTDAKFQGFLSYSMQWLLEMTDFKQALEMQGKAESEPIYRIWLTISESAREILMPFVTSKYQIADMHPQPTEYPIFKPGKSYSAWVKGLVFDLLRHPQGNIAGVVYQGVCRLIKVKDLVVAEFFLPYVVTHIILGGEAENEQQAQLRKNVLSELSAILQYQPPETASYGEREEAKLFYQAFFRIIDYFMRWKQAKLSPPIETPSNQNKKSKEELQLDKIRKKKDQEWISRIEEVIGSFDPNLLSQRAIDCNEYARALFFLEPHLEQRDGRRGGQKDKGAKQNDDEQNDEWLRESLQKIYTNIDDPDGLEGISAHLGTVTLDQQALNHRKAGRWTAAQTWYEIRLAESPEDADIQVDLLTCLKESGQHDVLLNVVEGMKTTAQTVNRIVPFAVEASWATGRWEALEKYLNCFNAGEVHEIFNLGVGKALLCLKNGDVDQFRENIQMIRDKVAGTLTYSTTSSLKACHDAMLRCHVLGDLDMLANDRYNAGADQQAILEALDRRLEVLGAYVSDKQYLLGIRRAAMHLLRPKFGDEDISSLWLQSGRLARKAGSIHQSFNAVLHAQQLGDGSATIENARLLYKGGHHRKAIQVLQLAIEEKSFIKSDVASAPTSSKSSSQSPRNILMARAELLLAKWLDATGQTHAGALRSHYQEVTRACGTWEKGHYYLGRHYKKVMEAEKALDKDHQSDAYLTGESAKLVIENFLRSLSYGTKYLSLTLPRILTLFLELGAQVDLPGVSREVLQRRRTILRELCKVFQKNIIRIPAYVFYTSLSQIVARIAHPNKEVYAVLEQIIIKVVTAFPRQALWSLFPFLASKRESERRERGMMVLQAVRQTGKTDVGGLDMKLLLKASEKLAEQLLHACRNGDFQSNRTVKASITRDLHFNHQCTPCPLVMPIEACLTATLPTLTDSMRKHKAFSRDVITIEAFLDHVLVLGSLAKPRKLTVRGSDGKLYSLLVKPKDDLRTDQRLMEFIAIVNRSLKKDAESSRRQLYVRAYAVTPLNEDCGIIEWVDGVKTLREILLDIYKTRYHTVPNYQMLGNMMNAACPPKGDIKIFTDDIIGKQFPPVLGEWFVTQFPTPTSWFAARLRYTRSCAVMSMVGTILGLGDRHGENVLLETSNGGIFHVDFNCLFDKGLTFTKPECVPFRLTHNMVVAMGIYRYEGPFRHCSELTLRILRQQEETLMSILEAFIHDPTLDLQKYKRREEMSREAVKLNPTAVVESIQRKVRGLLPKESIPLGVEGQVEELIRQAVDPRNLTQMYIGWCPFL